MLETVKVPEEFEPLFAKAQEYVNEYFRKKTEDPSKGTIELFGQRYILVRAASMSVDFFETIKNLFQEHGETEAIDITRSLLFDIAHAIGKMDAQNFHKRMGVEDPIEKLSAGPIHFSHTGWAFVDISPKSVPSPDENYYLIYDHPFSFESDAWIKAGKESDFPVCVMNAGYSSGWCEESFGIELTASEILCKAKGDHHCRFIMAPPSKIEEHIQNYIQEQPELARRIKRYKIPGFFEKQQMVKELEQSKEVLSVKVDEINKQRRAILNMYQDIEEAKRELELANATLELEIAERKKAERQIEQQNEFLNTVLESLTHPFYVVDIHDYTIKMSNSAAHLDNAVENQTCYSLSHKGDGPCRSEDHPCPIEIIKKTKKAVMVEHIHYDKVGNPRYVEVHGYPIFDSEGEVSQIIEYSLDITERKEAEQALQAANAELDAFVRTASHDLRSPLVSLHGFLTLLKEGEAENLSESGRHFLERVEANAQRMEQLLEDLLQLSRAGREMAPRENIDLNELLEFIKSDFAPLVEEKGATLIIPDDLPTLNGERSAISQIFTNLISNALKYMGQEPKPRVEVAWSREGDHYHFSVTDNGIGVDSAHHQRIFESFQSLKDERAGEVESSGVGLNIVKRIVERHEGKVWVESDGQNGSVFHFTIRASKSQKEEKQDE